MRAVTPSLYTMSTSVWIYPRRLRWPFKLVTTNRAPVSPPLPHHEESTCGSIITTPTNPSTWVLSSFDLFPRLRRNTGDSATSTSRCPTNRTAPRNRACSGHARSTRERVARRKFQLKWRGLVTTRENLQRKRWVGLMTRDLKKIVHRSYQEYNYTLGLAQ